MNEMIRKREEQRKSLPALFAAFLVLLLPIFFHACASTPKAENTGEYFDDTVITAKVKTAIQKDPILKVRQLHVDTYKGVVQLSGFVDTREGARKASDVAAEVAGVVSVKNDLIVK